VAVLPGTQRSVNRRTQNTCTMEIDKNIQWYTLRPDVSRFLCDLGQANACKGRRFYQIPVSARFLSFMIQNEAKHAYK
jgi:hypothetical protein